MDLFDCLIERKTLLVLRLFLRNPDEFYHIDRVSKETGVPLASAFRIINRLKGDSIIVCSRISKFKIYRLSSDERTKKLRALL